MAVNQPHHGGKSHSGPKWLLVLLGVVALLFATLAATTTFVDGDRVAASMQAPGRIVFELGTQSPTDTREIWVMDSDGGNLIQLTDNEVADRMPNWSPSGKEITFSNSNRDIYVMNADRTNVRQLTDLGDFLTNGPV